MVAHRLIERSLVQHRKRLGGKIRIFAVRCQGGVQLRGPLSKQLGIFKKRSDQLAGELRNCGGLQQVHECHCRQFAIQVVDRLGDRPVEVLAQSVQRVTPGVAFVWDVSVKQTHRGSFTSFGAILNPSGNKRGMRKANTLAQKVSHFQIRVHSAVHPAKQFQDELIAENDRRVALLQAC